ncbi:MAG: transposase [Thermoanaerobaculia bacterium]
MARQARVEYLGAVHHVTARGNRREAIFRDDRDRIQFLALLAEVVRRYGWLVTAWVLMTNRTTLPAARRALHRPVRAKMVERRPRGLRVEQLPWRRRVSSRRWHGSRNVIVIELPVIPGARAYGALQREIVARRGAKLIPKHHLAAVLADPENTTDGIHLTQRGHDELARRIGKLLKPS